MGENGAYHLKAQITAIELNVQEKFANGKSYKGHRFTYQPEPFKGKAKPPVTKFLFGNSDPAKDLLNIQVGDWAQIDFSSNGEFKNISKITKIDAPPSSTDQGTADQGTKYQPKSDNSEAIARAVALKEASSIVIGLAQTGNAYSAANLKKREFIIEEILQTARELLPFLKNTETVSGIENQDVDAVDVEQEEYGD